MSESETGSVTHQIDRAKLGDRDAKSWLTLSPKFRLGPQGLGTSFHKTAFLESRCFKWRKSAKRSFVPTCSLIPLCGRG